MVREAFAFCYRQRFCWCLPFMHMWWKLHMCCWLFFDSFYCFLFFLEEKKIVKKFVRKVLWSQTVHPCSTLQPSGRLLRTCLLYQKFKFNRIKDLWTTPQVDKQHFLWIKAFNETFWKSLKVFDLKFNPSERNCLHLLIAAFPSFFVISPMSINSIE